MPVRSRIEIVVQILETVNDLAEDNDGVTQTTIRYEIFLSSTQLKEYLIALTIHGLLRYNPKTRTYNATEKGLLYLINFYKMDGMINQLKLQQRQQQPHYLQNNNEYAQSREERRTRF